MENPKEVSQFLMKFPVIKEWNTGKNQPHHYKRGEFQQRLCDPEGDTVGYAVAMPDTVESLEVLQEVLVQFPKLGVSVLRQGTMYVDVIRLQPALK